MKRMRQDEDKTGMDKIKENEAAYNLKEYDSDKSNEEDVSRTCLLYTSPSPRDTR